MKLVFSVLFGASLGVSCALVDAAEAPAWRVSGLVDVGDLKLGMIEKPGGARWHDVKIFGERQRDESLEVVSIKPDSGTVDLQVHVPGGSDQKLSLHLAEGSDFPASGVVLENADVHHALLLYGQLAGRTTLIHPELPVKQLSMKAKTNTRVGAAKAFEQALEQAGIKTIPDGDRFVVIIAATKARDFTPSAPGLAASSGLEVPAGMVNFWNADCTQVAAFYAELANRKAEPILRPGRFRNCQVLFQSQTPLTRAEVLYALDQLLAWHGVKMEKVGEGLMRLEAVAQR